TLREQRHLEKREGRKIAAPREGERMWRRDADQGADRNWRVRGGGPGGHATPIVADDHTAGESQALDHPGDVECGGLWVISARGFVARAVAAQVHRGRRESSHVECWNLVPPCPPEFSESMQ